MRTKLLISLFFIVGYGHMLRGNPGADALSLDRVYELEQCEIKIRDARLKVLKERLEKIQAAWNHMIAMHELLEDEDTHDNRLCFEMAENNYNTVLEKMRNIIVDETPKVKKLIKRRSETLEEGVDDAENDKNELLKPLLTLRETDN